MYRDHAHCTLSFKTSIHVRSSYLNSIDIWSLVVEVEREAVGDLTIWHPGTEAVGRDQLVGVVRCQHTTHGLEGVYILIVLYMCTEKDEEKYIYN